MFDRLGSKWYLTFFFHAVRPQIDKRLARWIPVPLWDVPNNTSPGTSVDDTNTTSTAPIFPHQPEPPKPLKDKQTNLHLICQ